MSGKNIAVIAAAGASRRAGGDKLTQPLLGKPLICHTLAAFQATDSIHEIVLVVRDGQRSFYDDLVARFDLTKINRSVLGGKRRQDSIYQGLTACPSSCEFVVIHDGARPLVTPALIERSLVEARAHGATVCAVPATETIKRVRDGAVVDTPDRRDLQVAQTPQTIRYDLALEAFEQAFADGFYGTDDVALVERIGGRVQVFEGSYENIKVTTPEDLEIAERSLRRRADAGGYRA
ncbi:MAG: 2-C-methyl-D-erythritol 4-phosphate cytidylyltransferase [Candidatus Bipolaricaulia bacterium]